MIIKELLVTGFGKFKNKSIPFGSGINLIYGENESGKTTLHTFVDGMFYGFLKPNVKSAVYLNEHKKYQPWSGGPYEGSICFKWNDIDYRIERKFTKGMEETKIYVENTGEDITNIINTGSRGKILQPGIHFLGFNNVVYSNTIAIKQMGSETDDTLADELREKLINIATSNEDDISVKNTLSDIERNLKEIGSEKALKSPYGSAFKEVLMLKEEREDILKLKRDFEDDLNKKDRVQEQEDIIEKRLERVSDILKKAQYAKVSQRVERGKDIENSINILENKLESYKRYKNISVSDYDGCRSLKNKIDLMKTKIQSLEEEKLRLIRVIESNERVSGLFDEARFNELEKASNDLERLEESTSGLLFSKEMIDNESLIRRFQRLNKKKSRGFLISFIVLILYSVGMYLSIGNRIYIAAGAFQVMLIPLFFLSKKIKSLNDNVIEISQKISDAEKLDTEIREDLLSNEREQRLIYEKLGISSKAQLKSILDIELENKIVYKEKIKSIIKHNADLIFLEGKIQEIKNDMDNLVNELEQILMNNNVDSVEDYQNAIGYKNSYEDVLIELNGKRELLSSILNGMDIEKARNYLVGERPDGNIKDKYNIPLIMKRKEELSAELMEIRMERERIEERIGLLAPKFSKLVEIDEDIDRYAKQLEEMDKKRQSLELAKSTIENLSKGIHTDTIPKINTIVGDIISKITSGKYSDIRIGDRLDIGVISPETGGIVDINSLSGGTIDQLYFSIRFGIINSVTDKSLPLILDDAFIQYDDSRLLNMLSLLKEISKERQIILFSCQRREQEMLETLGARFNLITLS